MSGARNLAPIPHLGITRAGVRDLDLLSSGVRIDQPHRVVAVGFLYFLLWGISVLWQHRWQQAGLPPGSRGTIGLTYSFNR